MSKKKEDNVEHINLRRSYNPRKSVENSSHTNDRDKHEVLGSIENKENLEKLFQLLILKK